MKHAYLILAHNDYSMLQQLLICLDHERNDIYIHIDRKATFDGNSLNTVKSSLFVLSSRIDARWGDISLVEVEFLLFEESSKHGPYAYYHLLSGMDLPIKSQDFIHHFCDSHQGTEFIGYALNVSDEELSWRTQHYFLFSRCFKTKNILKKIVRFLFIKFQDFIGYKRHSIVIKKGSQWCSMTHDFITYLLQNRKMVFHLFNHTYCPDELFIQTLCWNSEFRQHLYTLSEEFAGNKRYIKWDNGELLTLQIEDVNKMFYSEKWFARKFTSENQYVVEAVLKNIL